MRSKSHLLLSYTLEYFVLITDVEKKVDGKNISVSLRVLIRVTSGSLSGTHTHTFQFYLIRIEPDRVRQPCLIIPRGNYSLSIDTTAK